MTITKIDFYAVYFAQCIHFVLEHSSRLFQCFILYLIIGRKYNKILQNVAYKLETVLRWNVSFNILSEIGNIPKARHIELARTARGSGNIDAICCCQYKFHYTPTSCTV